MARNDTLTDGDGRPESRDAFAHADHGGLANTNELKSSCVRIWRCVGRDKALSSALEGSPLGARVHGQQQIDNHAAGIVGSRWIVTL